MYGLADRELKDIGITRSEIEYLAVNSTDARIDPRRHAAARAARDVDQLGAIWSIRGSMIPPKPAPALERRLGLA